MDEPQDVISRMSAVTISREYGSGGGEIAARLAKRLNWRLVDHEIVVRIAQELGISIDEAEAQDERTEGFVEQIILSMRSLQPAMFMVDPATMLTDTRAYCEALASVVNAALTTRHVVIVGRAAQVISGDRRDVFHARIIAPLEERITYVMQREGLQQAEAQNRIQMKDHDRRRFLESQFHHHPDDPHLYDLVVNVNVLDLDSTVDLLYFALTRKAARLDVPTGQLGPGVGQPPYPGHPGDFHPPT